MSNRTDFRELADHLAEMFEWPAKVAERVETELHNAYIAGLEHERPERVGTGACGCRWCAVDCDNCDGTGEIQVNDGNEHFDALECRRCRGTGKRRVDRAP